MVCSRRWGEYNTLFDNVFDNGYLHMIEEIKKHIKLLIPLGKSDTILYNLLTGLRPQDAIDSFNLLLSHTGEDYLSKDKKLLQHYKYPELFLRRTKKAFISVVNENILSLVRDENKGLVTYNSLRLLINRRNHERFKMSYCRKIFATFLKNKGVETEIKDLLQARISRSIFAKHYYRPPLERFGNWNQTR
jgi:intergrase/recombinase